MNLFCLVLWHFKHSWLFYSKSSLYIYIYIYMICKHILSTFLNEPDLIVCTQLNGFKYCYVTVIT